VQFLQFALPYLK